MFARYIYSFIVLALLAACQPSGDKKADATGETTSAKPVYQTTGSFQTQIRGLVEAYLATKDALVASDNSQTGTQAAALLNAIGQVDTAAVAPEAKQAWLTHREALTKNVQALQKAGQLEAKRVQFEQLSERMYALVTDFGASAALYKQYCPMALNNQGAYWLSAQQEIKNPYFGDQMLQCGEVQEVLTFSNNP